MKHAIVSVCKQHQSKQRKQSDILTITTEIRVCCLIPHRMLTWSRISGVWSFLPAFMLSTAMIRFCTFWDCPETWHWCLRLWQWWQQVFVAVLLANTCMTSIVYCVRQKHGRDPLPWRKMWFIQPRLIIRAGPIIVIVSHMIHIVAIIANILFTHRMGNPRRWLLPVSKFWVFMVQLLTHWTSVWIKWVCKLAGSLW